jgi:hypothetical protein
MIAAICAMGALLVSIAGSLIIFGRTTERIEQNSTRIEQVDTHINQVEREHNEKLEIHSQMLSRHEVKIMENLAWREGFNAGRAKPQGT